MTTEKKAPTPARRKAWERASQKTRDKLAKAAEIAGFETYGKLADAIINHTHKVVKIEEEDKT